MTTAPTSPPAPVLDRFFTLLRRSPVTRSRDRVLAGVCAAVADRLGVSVTAVRVGTVLLAILGPAVALYLAAWLLLPDSQGRIRLERAVREGHRSSLVLLVVTVLAALSDLGLHARTGWLAVLVVGVLLVAKVALGRGSRSHVGPVSAPRPGSVPDPVPSPLPGTVAAPVRGPLPGPTDAAGRPQDATRG